MIITVDVDIESAKDKVWAAITDIENCKDMISGIIAL
jgi:carbon monoxide dehydrogenase subunit G